MGSIQELISAVDDNGNFTGDDEEDFEQVFLRHEALNVDRGVLRRFFLAGGVSAIIGLQRSGRTRGK